MPRFTIDLSDAAVAKLQTLVARTNENQGTALTVKDWIVLHLRELAVADDLQAAVDQLRQQHEADARAALDTAVRTARDALLADL